MGPGTHGAGAKQRTRSRTVRTIRCQHQSKSTEGLARGPALSVLWANLTPNRPSPPHDRRVAWFQSWAQTDPPSLMPDRSFREILLGLSSIAAMSVAACGARTPIDEDPAQGSAVVGGGASSAQSRGGVGGTTAATSSLSNGSGVATSGGHPPYQGSGGTNSIATVPPSGSGGTSPQTECPDEINYQTTPLVVTGDLASHQDRFTPSCRAASGTADMVLGWLVPQTDTYVFDTLGSETDTVLAIYSDLCGYTEFACNDDDAVTSKQSRIAIELSGGQFVTVVVDGWQGAAGKFELHISRAEELVNSEVPGVLPFAAEGSTWNLPDHTTSTCNDNKSSSDYTYLFTAPEVGTYRFSVSSPYFDPVLTLHADGIAGKELACNDDAEGRNPRINYALTAGQIVALIIDGKQGEQGDFHLYAQRVPDDSGACCAASNERLGCIEPDVARCVCEKRASCCREGWDATCVGIVEAQGCGFCGL